MILFLHLLVGAAIVSSVKYPVLGLTLAFLSHYALDFLPHTEYHIENVKNGKWEKTRPDFIKVALDIAFGLILLFIFSNNTWLVFAAALAAAVPDGLSLLLAMFPKNKLLKRHGFFHFKINLIAENKKLPLWAELSLQGLIALFAIFYLLQ